MCYYKFYIILFGLMLSACSTPQWRAENSNCEYEWSAKIPVDYKQIMVNKIRYQAVPDGSIRCNSSSHSHGRRSTTTDIKCVHGTKTISIPYTVAQTIDVNINERNAQVKKCVASNCNAKYGNSRCKL